MKCGIILQLKIKLIIKKIFYNDDGTLNENKLFKRLEYLNKVVRSCHLGNKLFFMPKTIETDLYELLL